MRPGLLVLPARVRVCRKADLPALEWFGVFANDRELIRATFEAQRSGRAVILVAEVNRAVAGQIWIDLADGDACSTAYLWALRVFPVLQNQGLGTRLLEAAESVLSTRGIRWATLSVERENDGARRLYERSGYRVVQADAETVAPRRPLPEGQRLLRKDLKPAPPRPARPASAWPQAHPPPTASKLK